MPETEKDRLKVVAILIPPKGIITIHGLHSLDLKDLKLIQQQIDHAVREMQSR